MSGLTGLIGGLGALLAIHGLIGVAEGAFCPASIAAAGKASLPWLALFGSGFAPIIATQLLQILPSWRVFMLVAVPGLIPAIILAKVLREPPNLRGAAVASDVPPANAEPWSRVLASYNIRLATFGLLYAVSPAPGRLDATCLATSNVRRRPVPWFAASTD